MTFYVITHNARFLRVISGTKCKWVKNLDRATPFQNEAVAAWWVHFLHGCWLFPVGS